MRGIIRRQQVASERAPNPWIVRSEGFEVRCPDLKTALEQAVAFLPLPPAGDIHIATSTIHEERYPRFGSSIPKERLEATLAISHRGMDVVMNRTLLKFSYPRSTFDAQTPERLAHLIMLRYDSDVLSH